jgi:hypothetical protein
MTFDFMVTNRVVDLVGENVDVSLRMGPLEDSGLVSRKIVDLRRVVCASPSYLAHHGSPLEPADLAHHACLILSRNPGSASWPFRIKGKLTRIDVKGPVSADSAEMGGLIVDRVDVVLGIDHGLDHRRSFCRQRRPDRSLERVGTVGGDRGHAEIMRRRFAVCLRVRRRADTCACTRFRSLPPMSLRRHCRTSSRAILT